MHRLIFASMFIVMTAVASFAAESTVPEEDRMIMTCDILVTAEQARGGGTGRSRRPVPARLSRGCRMS